MSDTGQNTEYFMVRKITLTLIKLLSTCITFVSKPSPTILFIYNSMARLIQHLIHHLNPYYTPFTNLSHKADSIQFLATTVPHLISHPQISPGKYSFNIYIYVSA